MKRVAWIGIALVLAGVLALSVGIGMLPGTVEGAYSNDDAGAAPAVAGVYTIAVEGRAWLIAGTALAAVGALMAVVALLRSRP